MTDKPIDIDAMLAKREEEIGSTDRFPFIARQGTWWAIDPSLASDEWQDQLDDLNADKEDGAITAADYRQELIDLYLGEKAEEFREAGGELKHLNAALEIYVGQKQDPTRGSSRSTRRRSKRR